MTRIAHGWLRRPLLKLAKAQPPAPARQSVPAYAVRRDVP
jgi:hypothetical protein